MCVFGSSGGECGSKNVQGGARQSLNECVLPACRSQMVSLSSEERKLPETPDWCHHWKATGNRTGDAQTCTVQFSKRPGDARSARTPSCANAQSSETSRLGGWTKRPTFSSNSQRRRRDVCVCVSCSAALKFSRCLSLTSCWRRWRHVFVF